MEILLSILGLLGLLLKAFLVYQSEREREIKQLKAKQEKLNQAFDSSLNQMVQKHQNERKLLDDLQDAMDDDIEIQKARPNGKT